MNGSLRPSVILSIRLSQIFAVSAIESTYSFTDVHAPVRVRGEMSRSHRKTWQRRGVLLLSRSSDLQNDAGDLKLLLFGVICFISTKSRWLGSDLSASGWQLLFEFMDDYEMTRIASRIMEEVVCCIFSRSTVKLQGRMAWKSTRPVSTIKSLIFALLCLNHQLYQLIANWTIGH